MTQIILLLLFPIGFYFYFFVERLSKAKYQKVFDDFQIKIQNNKKLSNAQKMLLYEKMLLKNDYKITYHSEREVKGEKKLFYMSLFAMGLIFYWAYFVWIQKPHCVVYGV
jgi:hypothetical protein